MEAEGNTQLFPEYTQINFYGYFRKSWVCSPEPLEKSAHYMYQTPNRIIYKGREILHSVPYPGYQYRFFNRKSGAQYKGNPHYFLKFDKQKYTPGVLKHPWYVYVDDSDAKIKKLQVLQDALDAKNQTWKQFLRWSVWNKLFGLAKILVKVSLLYLRYGFKDTLPPKLELARVKYKGLLFYYLMKQRFTGKLSI